MNSKISTLMLYCKTCGKVFPGIYILEGSTAHFRIPATTADTLCIYSRGQNNECATVDYMNWS